MQLGHKSFDPPGEARDDCAIVQDVANRMGAAWSYTCSEDIWNEVRLVAPHMFGGMSYQRLSEHQGLQWPCPDESHPGSPILHTRLWEADVEPRVAFAPSEYDPVADTIDDEYPFVLTTGRRLEFFNTGVQTRAYPSARRQEELVMIHPDDAATYGIAARRAGARALTSRRGHPARWLRSRSVARLAVHDPPLPGPDANQSADHRSDRSNRRDGRIQGFGGGDRASSVGRSQKLRAGGWQ